MAKQKPVWQLLIEQLDTSSDLKANVVIKRLCQIGAEAVPDLIKAANNKKKPKIRKWAHEALGEIGDARAAPVLIKSLKDEKVTIREHSINGLVRMIRFEAAADIAALLEDESATIREKALEALAILSAKEHKEAVRLRLKDPKAHIQKLAERMLRMWG